MNDAGRCIIKNADGDFLIYFNSSMFEIVDNGLSLKDSAVQSVMLDFFYPVNSGVYVQYPIAESNDEAIAFPVAERPATKFGGTWTELYDDENIFFRTKGTDYQPRTNGLSADQMQRITGSFDLIGIEYNVSNVLAGAFSQAQSSRAVGGGHATDRYSPIVTFDSANSPNARTGAVTEPRNRLFKIWLRTN